MRPDEKDGSPLARLAGLAGLAAIALSATPMVFAFIVWLVVPLHQLPAFVFSVPAAVLSFVALAIGAAGVVAALSRRGSRVLGVVAVFGLLASVAVVGVGAFMVVVGGALQPTS